MKSRLGTLAKLSQQSSVIVRSQAGCHFHFRQRVSRTTHWTGPLYSEWRSWQDLLGVCANRNQLPWISSISGGKVIRERRTTSYSRLLSVENDIGSVDASEKGPRSTARQTPGQTKTERERESMDACTQRGNEARTPTWKRANKSVVQICVTMAINGCDLG